MRRMEHPSELFEVGQEISAEEIGRWREGQLHLSARACEVPALRSFLLSIERGQVVAGTVSEVHNFGVFVHVDGEPDGLCTGFIRVPDLTWGWINHPSEAVEAGQRITAEVIISETRSGQVTLSLADGCLGAVTVTASGSAPHPSGRSCTRRRTHSSPPPGRRRAGL